MSERNAMKVVLLEGDDLWAETAEKDLARRKFEVDVLSSEYEFRQRLPIWRENPPNAFVLGTWVRWTHIALEMPTPTQDVIDEGYYVTAGLRMNRYLSQETTLKDIPVVLWGLDCDIRYLQRENLVNLPTGLHFLNKALLDDRVSLATTISDSTLKKVLS